MNIEKLKRNETKGYSLPRSYISITTSWPELKPLLAAFENRDYGTFMHSVAVHFTTKRLAQDLFLRLKTPLSMQQSVFNREPFWLLHDIGKVAADKNMDVAQHLVHPEDPMNRHSYDKARHWIHPQMSCDILNIWANSTSPRIKPYAKKWAGLAHLHDTQLLPFLPNNGTKNLSLADKFSLLIFSLCDTSMAMGLPRPNKKTVFSETQIMQALYKKYLSYPALNELFPNQNHEELKQYICTSIFDSLRLLQKNYPESAWVQPPTPPDQEKTQLLDELVIESWRVSEQFWCATMMRMDRVGVFGQSNGH